MTAQSIKWQTPLPGFSGATPAVWGNSVFVTSPDPNKDLILFCVDRKDGKVTVAEDRRERGRFQRPWQYGVTVPGDRWEGGLCAFRDRRSCRLRLCGEGTLEAEPRRGLREIRDHVDLRELAAALRRKALRPGAAADSGAGRLPRPGGGGGDRESYLLALEPATGKTLWKHVRPTDARMESMESYASPVPHLAGGKPQLLLVGGDVLSGHDPATGAELWRGGGINRKRGEWSSGSQSLERWRRGDRLRPKAGTRGRIPD